LLLLGLLVDVGLPAAILLSNGRSNGFAVGGLPACGAAGDLDIFWPDPSAGVGYSARLPRGTGLAQGLVSIFIALAFKMGFGALARKVGGVEMFATGSRWERARAAGLWGVVRVLGKLAGIGPPWTACWVRNDASGDRVTSNQVGRS